MDWDWKATKLPLTMALPGLLIQVSAIFALLFLTYGNLPLGVFATILGVVWLQVSGPGSVEQIGEWWARRELVGKLGEWFGREDVRREFHEALVQGELVDEGRSIETATYRGSALSQAIVGFSRAVVAILLSIYLIVIVVWIVWEHAGR